jgi:hypothetical protein
MTGFGNKLMWHTFIKSVCNGTNSGIGRFNSRSLIPELNNETIKALAYTNPSPVRMFECIYLPVHNQLQFPLFH